MKQFLPTTENRSSIIPSSSSRNTRLNELPWGTRVGIATIVPSVSIRCFRWFVKTLPPLLPEPMCMRTACGFGLGHLATKVMAGPQRYKSWINTFNR